MKKVLNFLKNIKSNKTKWKPFCNYYEYSSGYYEYLILVRGNKDTGEVFFKTITITEGVSVRVLDDNYIDTRLVWENLQNELNA